MKLVVRIPILLFCLVMLVLAGCVKKPAAPDIPPAPATTLHVLSESAYQIANATDSGEKEFEALYSSGLPGVSDDDYAKTVGGIFLKAQQANREYIGRLKTLSVVDLSNKAQVVAWTTELFGSVNKLVDEGVAGIKNPDAKAKLQAILAPIPIAIRTIAGALGIALTSSAGPCPGACAAGNFTEVNLGPKESSRPDRFWTRNDGEHYRVPAAIKRSTWPYRSAITRFGHRDQRAGNHADAGFPRPAECRFLMNPLRESWLFT